MMGMVMNGPIPIISSMFAAVACRRPIPRTKGVDSFSIIVRTEFQKAHAKARSREEESRHIILFF
jgi:hypothetical protein